MKDRFLEYVPLRDVPLAVIYSALWLVVLWAVEFPEDERIALVMVAYVALWISRLVVVNVTLLILRRLRRYALDVAEKLGIEVSGHAAHDQSQPAVVFVSWLMTAFVVMATLGLSFTLTGLVIAMEDGSPLGFYFDLAGWMMLGVGGVVLAGFFAFSFMLFASAEALSNRVRTGVIQIERSETAVSRLLRAQPQAA